MKGDNAVSLADLLSNTIYIPCQCMHHTMWNVIREFLALFALPTQIWIWQLFKIGETTKIGCWLWDISRKEKSHIWDGGSTVSLVSYRDVYACVIIRMNWCWISLLGNKGQSWSGHTSQTSILHLTWQHVVHLRHYILFVGKLFIFCLIYIYCYRISFLKASWH